MTLQLVPAPAGARVSASGDITHLCPFKDEVDRGRVKVSWATVDRTVELHSLAAYFSTFAEEAVSHEQLVTRIAYDLRALGLLEVHAELRFITAGLVVEVTRALPGEPL